MKFVTSPERHNINPERFGSKVYMKKLLTEISSELTEKNDGNDKE